MYDYSLSSNGDASRPKPPTMGRGRGRGRGVASQRDTQPRPGGAAADFPMMPPLVTYPSSPQTNPQNGLPTLGKLPPPTTNRDPGVAHVPTRGTKYPPAEESLSPPPVEVQATPAESEAEIRKKKIRKLKKMLRQVCVCVHVCVRVHMIVVKSPLTMLPTPALSVIFLTTTR